MKSYSLLVMRRKDVVLSLVVASLILVLFFFVPVVPMSPEPCITDGEGYGSASAYLLSYGVTYVQGNVGWLTPALANCI
jgi:hypothetical protein